MNFNKDMPEYVSNGKYLIDGEYWYTVWAYKNEVFGDVATPVINAVDSNALTRAGCESKITIPDTGPYDTIKAYREKDLRKYFNDKK